MANATRRRPAGTVKPGLETFAAAILLNMRYGVTMARRAWLGPEDILNTLPAEEFAKALRRT
jgi:histidinol phosphatase-like PHP family hydrolase